MTQSQWIKVSLKMMWVGNFHNNTLLNSFYNNVRIMQQVNKNEAMYKIWLKVKKSFMNTK